MTIPSTNIVFGNGKPHEPTLPQGSFFGIDSSGNWGIDAALFDFDGNLVSKTEENWHGPIWEGTDGEEPLLPGGLLAHQQIMPEDLRAKNGMVPKKIIEHTVPYAYPGLTEDEHKRIALEREETRVARLKDRVRRVPAQLREGTIELLEDLSSRGVPIFAVTSNDKRYTKDGMDVNGILHFFGDNIIDCNDVINPKPHPEPLIRAMQIIAERTGRPVRPERTFWSGDTTTDMKAGKAAGVLTFGTLYEVPAERLFAEGAHMVIPDFRRLSYGSIEGYMNILRFSKEGQTQPLLDTGINAQYYTEQPMSQMARR